MDDRDRRSVRPIGADAVVGSLRTLVGTRSLDNDQPAVVGVRSRSPKVVNVTRPSPEVR